MTALAQILGRVALMLLAPVLRLYLGSVRNLFGWSVQAICLSGSLVFEFTGTVTVPYRATAVHVPERAIFAL